MLLATAVQQSAQKRKNSSLHRRYNTDHAAMSIATATDLIPYIRCELDCWLNVASVYQALDLTNRLKTTRQSDS
jgi:hypothetical protein